MINSLFRTVFKMVWMKFVHSPAVFTSQPLCPFSKTRPTMIYLQFCLIISVLSLFGTILLRGGCSLLHLENLTNSVLIGILVMGLLTISALLITVMSQFGKNLQ